MPGLFGIVPLFPAPAETESADRLFSSLAKSLKTHREDSLESWKILGGRLIVGRMGRPVHRFKRHPPHRGSDGSFSVAACSMAEVALAPGGRLENTHPYAFFSQVVWEAETGTFSVTVDKCASFPVFFKATADWFAFAPEVSALVRVCSAPEPDETAFAQMLVNGHLLGDATLVTGVRRLQGGEALSVAGGQVSRRRWWRFAPGTLCVRGGSADLSAEMSARIHTAVARHLEDPGDAAIFLSGGADSRAIFGCALRAAGGSGARLRTVSWSAGEESSEGSDAAIARRIAAAAGTRHSFVRRELEAELIPRVVAMIGGLSEMAAFHAHELRIMEGLRAEGIARVLRGDEVFGYHGAVESIDQALDAIYIGRLVRSPVCRALLRRKLDAPFCARDEAALQEAIREAEGFSPLQAKDCLYFNHRLQCYLHTASYYKQSLLDHRNALLDGDILDFLALVPDEDRVEKRLFQDCMRNAHPSVWSVPLASSRGLEDWSVLMRSHTGLREFLNKELRARDSRVWDYLDIRVVGDFLEAFLAGRFQKPRDVVEFGHARFRFARWMVKLGRLGRARHPEPKVFHVRPERLLMRVLTLKLWLDSTLDEKAGPYMVDC
jgi:Asparagine synthase